MTDQQNFEEPILNEQPEAEAADEQVREGETPAQAEQRRIAEEVKKIAEQSTYAAKGFAGFVSERAREFYDEQKQKYQAEHPELDKEPGAKEFLEQFRVKLEEFVQSLTKGFHEMAERGRNDSANTPVTPEEPGVADEMAAQDPVVEDVVAEDAVVDAEPQHGIDPEQHN